jgi:ABC-type nitrate/sulfonate/bicarbonate transport system permease component
MSRILRAAIDAVAPILIVALLWEGLSRVGMLNPVMVPPPSRILGTLADLLGSTPGILLKDLGVSLFRLGVALALAFGLGVPLGILMATNRIFEWAFRPIVGLLMPIPALAWTPLLMVLLGLGNRTTITVTFLAAVIPTTYTAFSGVRSIGTHHVWAAKMMGASPVGLFQKVFLPGALEHIIPGMRLAFARAWRALIAAEMLAATNWGLGYLIAESGQYMDTEAIYATVVMISMTGLLVERGVLDWVERRTVRRWGLAQ